MPMAANGKGRYSKKFLARAKEELNSRMAQRLCPDCKHPVSHHEVDKTAICPYSICSDCEKGSCLDSCW